MDAKPKLVLACAAVSEELRPFLHPGMELRVLDLGHGADPAHLRAMLQETIDASSHRVEAIILGYGLCTQAVDGLRALNCPLVVPRVDDCIALFLGSTAAYRRELQAEPGTYYLSKGWIDVGNGPFFEYEHLLARRGSKVAERVIHLMLEHYRRLALIDTGQYDLAPYRAYAQRLAARFGLRYEELQGSTALLRKMVNGPWDGDFALPTRPTSPCAGRC